MSTALRICPFCEATCGLTLTISDGRVTGARGDRDDVFSAGFICPKGASFGELDNDPDRLTQPLIRRDGELTEATWDEAYAVVAERLGAVIAEHGGASVGVYLGNPNAHTIAGSLYAPLIIKGLGTRQVFSASTLDQMPKHVALGLMFGSPVAFTVPDLDRTDYLVIIGANPMVSNGSLATAADFPGKLRALRKRGGRLVVIDPARTQTAKLADRHLAPRPGTDAALLFAIVHVLFEEDLVDLGALAEHVTGVEEVRTLADEFSPEAVEAACGVDAGEIRELARELAAAPTAAVYGRMGTSTVEFGTIGSWLVDVINVLTGNLDRPGGAMFALGAAAPAPRPPRPGRGFTTGRWASRVSGYPEVLSELPAAALAEEIDTAGEGQIKAMITIAGNPVLSAPDGDRLDKALERVEFMLSVDPYLNETTRHADVILPPPPPSRSAHFDVALNNLAVRNNVRYSSPALPLDGRPDEPEILSRLALILYGVSYDGDPALVDAQVIATTLAKETANPDSPVAGRNVDELTAMLYDGPGYERRLDMMLRIGPYGDAFGARPDGLTIQRLKANPHGIDLGPLQPRIPEILRTPSGRIELAPEPIVADVARLRDALDRSAGGFLLIGRRHLRSNNSWMHNLPALSGGSNRCTLQIHPDDAADLGLTDIAVIKGPGGELLAPVEVDDGMRRGVVSLPHGWGHDRDGTGQRLAAGNPGANVNQLNDGTHLDPLSGTAVLNGIPVDIAPAG
ncbi:molybdopterin oxidoreductase family protein [Mycolicibacterium fortuitum]|uniref:molybdopterin oxidoreductase family protein n=1 Tax=Mycolicibacterium fortuitum TaxID=1766 RepID=UPI0007EA36E0|nr:molybdopterin oxidoreductase family protein [Mycolicibacterium fortuitum]MCA4757036.1 molybdopterin-dependent oxidoreductase [Mycolicibacterium fortuitum]OBB20639.1 molybdopterin-binding oxidoreductase [Mycolicibacterium fortuitum]OBB41647.1 molybdopterin-binding oxidoreductase [Mycolicibacterium fortuitum]OBB63234.1 molybdopterin-binding oxidoreductase [Mycolicibacterium fortuitum]OBF69245.1 molybdopterin-binding oxidoreductase [Mycolicibacterium fortuitum]